MKKLFKTLIFFTGMAAFLYSQNNWITTSKYIVKSEKISKDFDGIKIVQISDLQDAEFGKNNSRLIKKINEQNPDIVVITGDVVDCNRTNIDLSINTVSEISKCYPVYYVAGNHEGVTGKYSEIRQKLISVGVNVLDNESIYFGDDKKIRITGLIDPYFKLKENAEEFLSNEIKKDMDSFNIVLCHRPELFETYVNSQADLTFCGHAHGGQIRLPFIGGLFAPHQGFLPKYTSGMHEKNGSKMIVSRGLGNSKFPFRIFNRPEIVTVILKNE